MRKFLAILICLFLVINTSIAQSRVFREVASQISRQVKPVVQNEQFVGYVILDQLEKSSKDSFNYKLSFLDENLNDIGSYSFQQCDLDLKQAVFEQDVFCLAYLGSDTPPGEGDVNLMGKWKTKPKTHIYSQFFNLEGKLLNEAHQNVNAIIPSSMYSSGSLLVKKVAFCLIGTLKNALKVTTIEGKGFAFVYGDGDVEYPTTAPGTIQFGKKKEVVSNEHVLIYDLQGNRKWHKILPQAKSLALNVTSSGENIFILRKCYGVIPEGDYELLTCELNDSNKMQKKSLVDSKGNPLHVLAFKKNLSGKSAYLAGVIVNEKSKSGEAISYLALNYGPLVRGFYVGTFRFDLNGEKPLEHYAYWNDESMEPVIDKKGYIESAKSFCLYTCCFDDFEGNIYFAGNSISKNHKVTNFAPILKQVNNGKLTYQSSCDLERASLERTFFAVADEERKTNFLVIEDSKKIDIYNISDSKVVKTISRNPESGIRLEVFKAKSGHIMISEENTKERTIKLSIETI